MNTVFLMPFDLITVRNVSSTYNFITLRKKLEKRGEFRHIRRILTLEI